MTINKVVSDFKKTNVWIWILCDAVWIGSAMRREEKRRVFTKLSKRLSIKHGHKLWKLILSELRSQAGLGLKWKKWGGKIRKPIKWCLSGSAGRRAGWQLPICPVITEWLNNAEKYKTPFKFLEKCYVHGYYNDFYSSRRVKPLQSNVYD